MKKLLVFICLALCMALFVCSCGGGNDTDTNTDTNTDTQSSTNTDTNTDTDSQTPDDSDIIINEEKYRVFVCNEDGVGIAGAFVQYCVDDVCLFGETDENGYVEVPSGAYHVQRVDVSTGDYHSIVFEQGKEPHFEGDSKVITVVLDRKAK